MITLYCERTGPGLWAEPINAATNIAFGVAAWCSWRLVRRAETPPFGLNLLITLICAIGIGSTLFHTFATPWAMGLDVVPILLFQLCYLWLYSRRVIALNKKQSAALLAALAAAVVLAAQFPHIANQSLSYAPAWLALAGLAGYHAHQRKRDPWLPLKAAGLFTLSLICRTVDRTFCNHWPLGTHFLWHLLNGAVLYLLMRALVLNYLKK